MPSFIINIQTSTDRHKLVQFEVPDEVLVGKETYDDKVNMAGWWYMNRVDAINCTGDYAWSVFPAELINNIGWAD